jgi:dihydrofolate synthase / folylpolyglutamate synthase
VARIRPAVAALARAGHATPSFFEVTNAIAFGLFAGRVDHGVVETGVGGLLDATNTISRPDEFAVITARAGLPVVVSGSFHLLAAVRLGTSAR